ncbi:Glycoside hydrolase family 27 protein [Dioscorea alata]|uniref:Glycoside hydrolase family 27 protein n=1 Tax=Dioscorea alata TaxID=55571 RepID=A0ACB7W1N9_DIOAL|nr:Glycoside hydrolase family 27 protein [Dioscorea alata]
MGIPSSLASMRASVSFILLVSLICRELYEVKSVSEAGEVAMLPPRGWNSYDSFSWVIDEDAFLYNAEILSKRLLQYGYEYAVVDYLWYRKNVNGSSANAYGYDNIDPWGRVCPDPDRWPSSKGGNGFKEVAQIVHKMGLKFGIHVMTGISVQAVDANTPILDVDTGGTYKKDGRTWQARDIGLKNMTCKWMDKGFMSVDTSLAAGRAFLRSLYRQYAQWGVDFVKLDCVFGTDLDAKQIITVSELLQELDRPVVLSLSPGERVMPSMSNGISNHVNMYRITGDDWDKWEDVAAHFDVSRTFAAANKIGAEGLNGRSWPDLDMLPLGWLTDPSVQQGPHRKCYLTLDEQRTQMTLWSMAKSPLMFGGDLRHLDGSTFNLITNPTLLEINHYSSNNMEFPYVFSTKMRRNRLRSLPHRFMNLVHQNNAENNILSTSSCEDDKAKRWTISSFDRDLDQICWQFDTNRTGVKSYCLYKRDKKIKYKQETETFQLLMSSTANTCLGISVNRKLSASEIRSVSLHPCGKTVNTRWGLNNDGTLVDLISGLCAIIVPKKVNVDAGGIRSWIATGRRGEIYLAFFNLYNQRNRISAKVEDFAEVLKGNFPSNCSYDGKEIWTGKQFHMLSGTISMMVEKHGSVLFVLTCHKFEN